MATSIATKLTRNLRLFSLYNNSNNGFAPVKSIQRSLFAPAALGIDGFQQQRVNTESQVLNNKETLKRRITEGITNNTQIFSEDLKTFLFLVKTDEELDILKKCLEKYEENSKTTGISEYSFGPQIIRLCYVLNKPDVAIEVFFNEKLKSMFTTPTSLLILMNKLNEDRRYEDTIKVFDRVLQIENYFFNPKFNNVSIPQDIMKLAIEAYYYSNNPEAINKIKALIAKQSPERRMNRMTLAQSFFTAIKHKDYDFALELASKLDNGGLQYNLKAIAFALLNRFNDSFEQVQKIIGLDFATDENRLSRDVFVFPATLKYMREQIEAKKDNDALKKFEEVSKSVFAANRLSRSDITDIFTRVILTRLNSAVNRQRDGAGGFGIGGGGGYGQRFNRFNSGDEERQGGGFRPQSDRFQQDRFQQGFRPQSDRQGFRPQREFNSDRPQSDRFQQQGFRPRGFNQDRPQSDRQQNRPRREMDEDEF